MAKCLNCFVEVDISQDFCADCTSAMFKADYLDDPRDWLRRHYDGLLRERYGNDLETHEAMIEREIKQTREALARLGVIIRDDRGVRALPDDLDGG